MKEIPLVSIICTAYNQEAFIRDTLDGFIIQKTNFSFEIIISDDASTDSTADIIRKYENEFPTLFNPFYYTENKFSKGIPFFYTELIPSSQGKYIAFCEGDDYWTDPYKLQKQVDFLEEHKDYGLVWTDVDFYLQSSSVFKRMVFHTGTFPIHDSFTDVLIHKSFLAPATWLFRKDCMSMEINNYCDGTFALLLDILAVTKIKYLDEVTAVYRELNQSASHSPSSINRYKRYQGLYGIQKDYLKKYKISYEIEEAIDINHFESVYPYVVIFDENDNIKRGKEILKRSNSKSLKIRVALSLSGSSLGIYTLKVIFKLKDKYCAFKSH